MKSFEMWRQPKGTLLHDMQQDRDEIDEARAVASPHKIFQKKGKNSVNIKDFHKAVSKGQLPFLIP